MLRIPPQESEVTLVKSETVRNLLGEINDAGRLAIEACGHDRDMRADASYRLKKPHNVVKPAISAPPMVTHVLYDGEVVAVWDMPSKFGFTYEQLKNRKALQEAKTHCMLGENELSLIEFEEKHEHITLSDT